MSTIIKFLKTIFLVDLLKGLWVTLKYTPQARLHLSVPRGAPTDRATLPRSVAVADRAGNRRSDLHRLRPVRQGVSGRSDCSRRTPRTWTEDQNPRLFRLQPVPLQLLRTLRGGLPDQAVQGADHERGLRARNLQSRYADSACGPDVRRRSNRAGTQGSRRKTCRIAYA